MKFESIDEFVKDARERMIRRDESFKTLDITSPVAENHLEGEDSRFANSVNDSFDNETIVDLLNIAKREDSVVNDLFLGFFQIDHEVSLALTQLFHNQTRMWERLAIQRCPGRVWQACLSLIVSKGNIETLCLYHNELGYPGFSSLAMILASNPRGLVTLDLEEYISPSAAEAFGAGLQMNTTLLKLDMHDCRLDMDSVLWISEGLKGNCSLRELRLDRCQLSDQQCSTVLDELVDHPTLERIAIDVNLCSIDTLKACTRILEKNRLKNLKELTMAHQICLIDPRISSPLPVGILSGALETNTSLRVLSLANNLVDPIELETLMGGVKRSKIEDLDLEGCRIDDEALQTVLSNLPQSLRKLVLTENLLAGDLSNELLLQAVVKNDLIESLEIEEDLDCWSEVCFYTRLNKGGRRLLGREVDDAIWPYVFERVYSIDWTTYHLDSNKLGFAEDVIYTLLKGPALCGRCT